MRFLVLHEDHLDHAIAFPAAAPYSASASAKAVKARKAGGEVDPSGFFLLALQSSSISREALFDEPLYGVIGGLHFPVTASRMPYRRQKVMGTGRLSWQHIKEADVRSTVAFLEEKRPELVGISAHGSCDWTLDAFKEAFGDRYHEVVVGREIVV